MKEKFNFSRKIILYVKYFLSYTVKFIFHIFPNNIVYYIYLFTLFKTEPVRGNSRRGNDILFLDVFSLFKIE